MKASACYQASGKPFESKTTVSSQFGEHLPKRPWTTAKVIGAEYQLSLCRVINTKIIEKEEQLIGAERARQNDGVSVTTGEQTEGAPAKNECDTISNSPSTYPNSQQ
jgi:hypothetical protein